MVGGARRFKQVDSPSSGVYTSPWKPILISSIYHCISILSSSRFFCFLTVTATRQDKRCELQRKSLGCLKQATSLDPDDHMAQFQMAMQLALSRQVLNRCCFILILQKTQSTGFITPPPSPSPVKMKLPTRSVEF